LAGIVAVIVRLEGGPAHGYELALMGGTPSYLMLLKPPEAMTTWEWIIVGAGFDDHWLGQLRYEKVAANDADEFEPATTIYRYAPSAGSGA
jgi:hypothetical protein